MKIILAISLLVITNVVLANNEFDIRGNYSCINITMKASVDGQEKKISKINLNYQGSLTSLQVNRLERGGLSFHISDGHANSEIKQIQTIFAPEVISVNGILVKSLKAAGNTYDKIEMTFFKDANSKTKVLMQGVTVVVPSKNESDPHAYNFAIECTK